MEIYRGSTPTHLLDLEYPLRFITDIRITYEQNDRPIIIKKIEDCKKHKGLLAYKLTQEETYRLIEGKGVINIRAKTLRGNVIPTEKIRFNVIGTGSKEVI